MAKMRKILIENMGSIQSYLFILGFVSCIFSGVHAATFEKIRFTDVVANGDSGIHYRHLESSNNAILDAIKQIGFIGSADVENRARAPTKPYGAPGVAIFDYDRDGDLDIYVTNSKGAQNSLYQNQYKQTGKLEFVDVAFISGVTALEQDSTGVCFGDIDNDGDHDLLVLGNNGTQNLLFENMGGGNFIDISENIFNPDDIRHPTTCSMGDINADGLLDIAIGNTFNSWVHRLPLVTFDNDLLLEANQVFFNKGNNSFEDKSEYAGINDDKYVTWSLSLVDIDLDGDVDLIAADDQGAKAPTVRGGRDDGYVRVYKNNGKGKFTNVTEQVGTNRYGAWMGLSFGDFNSDGYMDIFSTNTGFYITAFLQSALNFQNDIGDWTSGWFLGQSNGQFVFPGAGEMKDTPFGWGTSVTDYDNDGDSDVIFHGGVNMGIFVEASNPGAILRNDGLANFSRDAAALSESTDHLRRNVQGMAVGDLNDDGFMDIVSVSSEDWPSSFPLAPLVPSPALIGTPFDDAANFWPVFIPADPSDFSKGFFWSGLDTREGSLSIEVSSADNKNNWVKVNLHGSAGMLGAGKVNRDGIGAVVVFTPKKGKPVMWPVVAGSSYASQDSLEWVFGLGRAKKGMLEVLWPGGIRNKLYNVQAGEKIIFPEIPCSFDNQQGTIREYFYCVRHSLIQLHKREVLNNKEVYRFFKSAMKAYFREKRHQFHKYRE
jgi:hypothetical protein